MHFIGIIFSYRSKNINHKSMKKPIYQLLKKMARYSSMGILGQFLFVCLCFANDADLQPTKIMHKVAMEAVYEKALLIDEEEKMLPVVRAAIEVSGKVTASSDGLGIPGVNILIKDVLTGTVTDIEGNYTINVPNEDDTLVFSSIGFITQEVPVNGRGVIDVVLE